MSALAHLLSKPDRPYPRLFGHWRRRKNAVRQSEAIMAALLVLAKRELNVSALSLISLKAGPMYPVNVIDEAIDSSE